jgi:hypothetical protein
MLQKIADVVKECGAIIKSAEIHHIELKNQDRRNLLTEYDEMTEEVILEWEDKAREYIMSHSDGKKIKMKNEDDIVIAVKDEQIFWDMALKYHNYYRKGEVNKYWDEFAVDKAY